MIEVKEIDEGKWGLYLDGVLLGDSKNRYEADHAKQILLRYLQKHRRMQQVRLTDWAVRA